MIELSKICYLKTGKTPPSKEEKYFNGDINWYTPSDLDNGKVLKESKRTISDLAFTEKKAVVFNPNTLLMTCIGEIGKVGITSDICSSNQQITALIPKDNASVDYLYYAMKFIKPNLNALANNAVVQILNNGNLSKIKIPLPPLQVQKKIAEILDAADALRKKTQQIIEHYDQLAQSIFLDMFGDPVSNPRKWEVRKLKSLSTKILSGNTPKGGSKVYVDDGILFLRSQNVWRNRLKLDDVAYIDNTTHTRMRNTSLKNRDILMTKTGRSYTENSSLGRAAMFVGEDESANINGHVYLIRLKKEIINEFVLYIITTNSYRDYMRRVCVGGIDKMQLNKHHLEDFPIINPPAEIQNQFVRKLKLIEQQKELAKQSLQQSEDLFNALLQKAFLPAGRQGKGELVN